MTTQTTPRRMTDAEHEQFIADRDALIKAGAVDGVRTLFRDAAEQFPGEVLQHRTIAIAAAKHYREAAKVAEAKRIADRNAALLASLQTG